MGFQNNCKSLMTLLPVKQYDLVVGGCILTNRLQTKYLYLYLRKVMSWYTNDYDFHFKQFHIICLRKIHGKFT